MDMNSVDRIEEYSTLKSEKYLTDLTVTDKDTDKKDSTEQGVVETNASLYQSLDVESGGQLEMTSLMASKESSWPTVGEVIFDQIYLTYKVNVAPVLR